MNTTDLCRPLPSMGCQCFQIPIFFRIVPSPLQGTSHKIRSKRSCCSRLTPSAWGGAGILMIGYIDASRLVTISAGLGSLADWWMRRCVRLWSLSLARRRPEGIDVDVTESWACKASNNCAVCMLGRKKMVHFRNKLPLNLVPRTCP